MDLIMNLISGTYNLCERRKHVFMIIRKYTIIFQAVDTFYPYLSHNIRKWLTMIDIHFIRLLFLFFFFSFHHSDHFIKKWKLLAKLASIDEWEWDNHQHNRLGRKRVVMGRFVINIIHKKALHVIEPHFCATCHFLYYIYL